MHICHVTPHLPPDQAANALLPAHLGTWTREGGGEVSYVAWPPRAGRPVAQPGPVAWVAPVRRGASILRASRIASIIGAIRIVRAALPVMRRADLVHVHSNGLLSEIGALVATRLGKPFVLTLYGTEIWHYRPRRIPPDLFTQMYRRAAHVTFYSEGLLARARELELTRPNLSVIYPPVAHDFRPHDVEGQRRVREEMELRARHVLVNVKRLHPLAGQRCLIEALEEVVRVHPDLRLFICGTGPLEHELREAARQAGVERHVTFTGLVDNRAIARYCAAADLFVLPSLLEACPTVALEALAAGTPVVSSNNPGGIELNDLFGRDVTIVPKENRLALAEAIIDALEHKRRTTAATRDLIEREFRPAAVADRFRRVYERALDEASRAAGREGP